MTVVGTASMSGEAIYHNFTEGDARRLQMAGDKVAALAAAYEERAHGVQKLQEQMGQYWEGDSASKANAGAGLLAQAFVETAKPLDDTNTSLTEQTSAFDSAKSNVVEVPPAPEKPNPWTTGLKAAIPVAGPFMAADDINSYQDGMQAHNEAAQRNVDVMNQYSAVTNTTQGALPSNFGVLAGDGSAISIGTQGTGSVSGEQIAAPDSTRASGTGVPVSGPVTSGGPVSGPPNVGSPMSSGSVPPGPSSGGPSGPVSSSPNVGTGGPGTPTNTSGTPVGGMAANNQGGDQTRQPSRRPSTTSGFGRSTGGGTGRNLAGERLRGVPDPKGGSAKGGVPGRGAIGEGAGGRAAAEGGARGGALGTGKGSGVGAPGGAAAAAEAGAKGAATTGRGGTAAGAPMGAGGRGKGEDDQEHKRAEYLQENDPDDVFIGDLGKTTPPVIGQ